MKDIASVIAFVLLLAVVGGQCRREGEYKAEIARLERETRRIDTIYVRDTLRLTKVRHVTDSIFKTDTLWRDTLVMRVIREERAACDNVILTCEARVAKRDSTIEALKKNKNWTGKALWLLGGFAAGVVLTR